MLPSQRRQNKPTRKPPYRNLGEICAAVGSNAAANVWLDRQRPTVKRRAAAMRVASEVFVRGAELRLQNRQLARAKAEQERQRKRFPCVSFPPPELKDEGGSDFWSHYASAVEMLDSTATIQSRVRMTFVLFDVQFAQEHKSLSVAHLSRTLMDAAHIFSEEPPPTRLEIVAMAVATKVGPTDGPISENDVGKLKCSLEMRSERWREMARSVSASVDALVSGCFTQYDKHAKKIIRTKIQEPDSVVQLGTFQQASPTLNPGVGIEG